MLSELFTYQDQPDVLHLMEVSQGALWHKYTLDGGTEWHPEALMGPGHHEVSTPPLVSLSVTVVEQTAYVMCEAEDGGVWMAREGPVAPGVRWDRRRLP